MPWSGDFPFDTLGGVGMAVCFVYIIYKQYLFSFSMRATTGAIYLIAVAFLPMIILEPNIDHVIGQTDSFTRQFITVFVVLQCLWMVLVMTYARKWWSVSCTRRKSTLWRALWNFRIWRPRS